MFDRRVLSVLLLGAPAALMACAGGDGPPRGGPRGGHGGPPDGEGVDMLFISPMGEPFRAKTPAPYPVVAWFKGADTNGDGKIDLVEFMADAERFFHVLDLTRDGVLDHREIYYYEHELVPEVLGSAESKLQVRPSRRMLWLASDMQLAQLQGGPGGGGGGGRPGGVVGSGAPQSNADGSPDRTAKPSQALVGAAPYNMLADPEPVEGADLRLTGTISLGDWKTRAEQRFHILDESDRGYLTLARLPETQAEQIMPHHRGKPGPRGLV